MGLCTSREVSDPAARRLVGAAISEEVVITNVEEAIADYAWKFFKLAQSRVKRLCLRRADYTIEVPKDYFYFEKVDETVRQFGDSDNAGQSLSGTSACPATVHETILLERTFINNSDSEKTYEFTFEKSSNASVQASFQEGFAFGGRAKFNFKVGGVELEARSQTQEGTGHTSGETMTTSEKSVFTLQAGKSCKLVVVEEDRSIHAMFEATVKMIMPTGKALISIKDKHGNIVYRIHLMNLPDVFPDHRVSEEVTNAVQFPVKGVLGGSVFPTYKIRLEDLPEPNQGAAEGMERPPGLRED